MARLVKIGLTGGIAVGKSTVLRRWERSGAQVIEADHLAHQTFAPGTTTWQEVVRAFGEEIVNPDQTINRHRLGEIVFADDGKRRALEGIVHPAVRRMWTRALQDLERDGRDTVAVVAIPLLFETGAEKEFEVVVAVGCSEPTQIARLAAKGLSEAQARARMRAQWPVALKMERADFVIWNDGVLEVLYQQADIVWNRINPAPRGIKESRHAA